jgi:GR25 family glycosyltransferase involved in LPS biosynthesis
MPRNDPERTKAYQHIPKQFERVRNEIHKSMHALVINLPDRPDRWEQAEKELSPHFELTRIDAIKKSPGWLGLNETMMSVFKLVTGPVLVFEDDATYRGNLSDLLQAIKELPPDFDMLLLGANIKDNRLERVSPKLVRTFGCWTTHAIYYSHRFCQEVSETGMSCVIDEYFRTTIHPRGNSYIVTPFLSYQRQSFSDIEGSAKDYTDLFNRSNRMATEVK